MKQKLQGKRLYSKNSVKYLGNKIDENLDWHQQFNNVAVELKGANPMLSKVRYFLDKKSFEINLSCNFWNHTYSIPVLFGHRILIPLKDFIFYKKIFTANVLFES